MKSFSITPTTSRSRCWAAKPSARGNHPRQSAVRRVSVMAVIGGGNDDPDEGPGVSRRELVLGGAAAATGAQLWMAPRSHALPTVFDSTVGGLTGSGFDLEAALRPQIPKGISSPGLSWGLGNREKQLFFPKWMEGSWEVTADFGGFAAPLGSRFTSSSTPGFTKASILAMADAGATPVAYEARYVFSKDEGGVVADRPYNIPSCVDAFLGRAGSVRSVEYDPVKNPTRYRVVYSTPGKDTREQQEDLRKAEVFVNNRLSSTKELGGGLQAFYFAEFQRQVGQAARQGSVNDFVIATRLEQQEDGTLTGLQRVAAFLQPQDPAYFDVGGKAVAIYDYNLKYTKLE